MEWQNRRWCQNWEEIYPSRKMTRTNNTMVMEKDCSGSLDARYARWRCTKCKHKWERWIIGTTWMMTGKWREMDFSWKSSENKHKESERGGYAKEEIWWCCLIEVSKFISLQSCNFMNSPTFNGLNGLQVEWQVLFNAHFDVLIPYVDIFLVHSIGRIARKEQNKQLFNEGEVDLCLLLRDG